MKNINKILQLIQNGSQLILDSQRLIFCQNLNINSKIYKKIKKLFLSSIKSYDNFSKYVRLYIEKIPSISVIIYKEK